MFGGKYEEMEMWVFISQQLIYGEICLLCCSKIYPVESDEQGHRIFGLRGLDLSPLSLSPEPAAKAI